MDARLKYPATERNREPIGDVLEEWLPAAAQVLEIASGSGEHALYFAARFPAQVWQPSDMDADCRASIEAWRESEGAANLLAAIELDVTGSWPEGPFDAIFCANMIHIAPWEACLGLIAGAGRVLGAGGSLVTYGPYKMQGQHTAPSNEEFERWLMAKNGQFGVRDAADVERAAEAVGLVLVEMRPLPANNFCLHFRKPAV